MSATAAFAADTFSTLVALVRRHTGIAMNAHKGALLEGRLGRRMRELRLPSYEDYLALVQAGGSEVQVFIDMVTTNDTVFFRTPAVWDYIADQFLPVWYAAHPGQCLRIWSAAAASGEEAYSAAMLCEQFRLRHPDFRYQIKGTDICTAVVARAQAGCYGGRSAEKLRASHPQLLALFFRPDGDGEGVAIQPELKTAVQFSVHNLFAPPKTGVLFDLVLLRNVLIYFDEENQRKVLANVQSCMAPEARLIIGEQESITRLNTPLQFCQQHVYRAAGG